MKIFEIYAKIIALFFFCVPMALAQKVDTPYSIELGETRFPIERPFTISVVLPNTETRPVLTFPDVPGLTKIGTTAGVRSIETTDREQLSLVIKQSYLATAPGQYRIPAFALVVNGQSLHSDGATLTVEAGTSASVQPEPTLLLPRSPEAGDAFLRLASDKTTVFTEQGILVRLSLFVAENYPAELRFDRLDAQVQSITERLRPPGVWEENANIREVQPGLVTIGKRRFTEYRLYQATLYPLTGQVLSLPSASLTMLRLPAGTTAKPADPNTKPERVTFASRPLAVTVQALPPHPLQSQVAVGEFRLVESLPTARVAVGQSVSYEFRIEGIGNIVGIGQPTVVANPDITVYPPAIQTSIDRSGRGVSGHKTFRYFVLPRQTGSFALADMFQWVYFDPQRARYDTLRSLLRLTVGGAVSTLTLAPEAVEIDSSRSALAGPGGVGSIYRGLEQMDSTRQPLNTSALLRAVANVLLIGLLLSLLFVFFRK